MAYYKRMQIIKFDSPVGANIKSRYEFDLWEFCGFYTKTDELYNNNNAFR